MLIYHFGSREGLEVAIVQAVEQAQPAFLRELLSAPRATSADAVRTMWRHLAGRALSAHERLFFEIYALALQGRPGTAGLLDGVVDVWVEAVAERAGAAGIEEGPAWADARLGVTVMRGLLLDLLATDDRRAPDAALDRCIELYVSEPSG